MAAGLQGSADIPGYPGSGCASKTQLTARLLSSFLETQLLGKWFILLVLIDGIRDIIGRAKSMHLSTPCAGICISLSSSGG